MQLVSLINQGSIFIFVGILARVSALCLTMPFWGHRNIPTQIKVLLSLAISLMVFPVVLRNGLFGNLAMIEASIFQLISFIVLEVIIGLIIGFVAKMVFESISFAFSYMGLQMGFSFATAFDPNSESSSPIVAQFVFIMAFLLFLAVDGHHFLIRSIFETFNIIPIGLAVFEKALSLYVFEIGNEIFLIAIRLAAPVAVIAFIANVGFGVIARSVPQINVLVISFTVNILIGLVVLYLVLPVLFSHVLLVFSRIEYHVYEVMKYLNG